MPGTPATTQRSFRLPTGLMRRLERRSNASGDSLNSIVVRYLTERERMETHPHITFWQRPAGREAMLVGHRLSVADVVETIRGHRGSITAATKNLGLARWEVEACADYYADYSKEIDELIRRQEEFADEHEGTVRRRRNLGT